MSANTCNIFWVLEKGENGDEERGTKQTAREKNQDFLETSEAKRVELEILLRKQPVDNSRT